MTKFEKLIAVLIVLGASFRITAFPTIIVMGIMWAVDVEPVCGNIIPSFLAVWVSTALLTFSTKLFKGEHEQGLEDLK